MTQDKVSVPMKPRLRRVSLHSKEPTVKRLEDIAHNIRVKTNDSCHVGISCWSFQTGNEETTFLFYQPSVEGTITFSSWKLLLNHCAKVMAEGGV